MRDFTDMSKIQDILRYTKPKGDALRWVAHAGLLARLLMGPISYWWVTAVFTFGLLVLDCLLVNIDTLHIEVLKQISFGNMC